MNKDVIILDNSKIKSEYKGNLNQHFKQIPEVAKSLLKKAKISFSKIERNLHTIPEFINVLKSAVPEKNLQAVFTDEQKRQIANGTLKLMTKKDGSLMASLINPKTRKIVANISLKSVKVSPEMNQAIVNFSTQMQLAQIAEQIQYVQIAIEDVRKGQENDRLATAYSCQQKLIQSMEIKNHELKKMFLLNIVASAEDSRNLLMLSQKNNVNFIMEQPESLYGKIRHGASPKEINNRMSEILENLCAVNIVSFTEAMAYQELEEIEAARKSLEFYVDFIEDVYISVPRLMERLDMVCPTKEDSLSKTIPNISKKIKAFLSVSNIKLLGKR